MSAQHSNQGGRQVVMKNIAGDVRKPLLCKLSFVHPRLLPLRMAVVPSCLILLHDMLAVGHSAFPHVFWLLRKLRAGFKIRHPVLPCAPRPLRLAYSFSLLHIHSGVDPGCCTAMTHAPSTRPTGARAAGSQTYSLDLEARTQCTEPRARMRVALRLLILSTSQSSWVGRGPQEALAPRLQAPRRLARSPEEGSLSAHP